MQPNALIQVTDAAGATANFRVIATATYPADAAPLDTIFGASPTARLNIVTCTGKWDAAHEVYTDRFVVFAAREN